MIARTRIEPTNRPILLVVDDDNRNRQLIRRIFEKTCDILEAADGGGALACVGKSQVDLILLDILMHGSDGIEVCGGSDESVTPLINAGAPKGLRRIS